MSTIDAQTMHRYALAVSKTLADRYPRCFPDHQAFETHRAAFVERLKHRLAWDAYDENAPLDARAIGQVDRGDYVIEKIIFESVPDLCVPALVYRPAEANVRRPAIVNPYGHWAHDRWEPIVQARCIAQARLGYIALTYDPLCQGERSWMGRGHESQRPNCLLAGHTMIGLMCWETRRAIDYLLTRDDVDPERIACTGASGGGLNTLYTAAVDDRIAVAAPCVYATNLAALVARGHAGCCAYLPNHALVGEVEDVYAAVAPRKLLILGAARDDKLCTMQSQIAAVAEQAYAHYDPSFLSSFSDPDSEHDYSLAMRERFYAWCARWLDGRTDVADRVSEPPGVTDEIVPPNDDRLTVFRNESDRGVSLHEINRRIAANRRASRPSEKGDILNYRRRLRADLRDLMGDFPADPEPAHPLRQHTDHFDRFEITRFVIQTEPDMPIRVIRYRNPNSAARTIVLDLDFDAPLDKRSLHRRYQLSSINAEIWRILPRNTGKGKAPNEDDDLYCMALAKPTLAGQVHDVRAVRRWIEARRADQEMGVTLQARGRQACIVASYCALLDDYESVQLDRSVGGWQQYLDREVRPPYAAFVPRQLEVCALPEIWAALAPTRLTISGLQDANGKVLSHDQAHAILAPVRRAYRTAGHPRRFTCEPRNEFVPDTTATANEDPN